MFDDLQGEDRTHVAMSSAGGWLASRLVVLGPFVSQLFHLLLQVVSFCERFISRKPIARFDASRMLEALPIGVAILDKELNVLFSNENYQKWQLACRTEATKPAFGEDLHNRQLQRALGSV